MVDSENIAIAFIFVCLDPNINTQAVINLRTVKASHWYIRVVHTTREFLPELSIRSRTSSSLM